MQNSETLAFESNLSALANINELAALVVTKVAGNTVANTLNGKPVAPPELRTAIAARMRTALLPYLKG